MDLTAIETITKYRTSDGREFSYFPAAQAYAGTLALTAKANERLKEGGSVADALRIVGCTHIDPILEKVTLQTALVISHWQCRDTPGYRVTNILSNGEFRVYGDAGSWSGPYGGDVTVADLVRYASDKRTVWEQVPPSPQDRSD